jgi:large subunit ribosomal protein L10e
MALRKASAYSKKQAVPYTRKSKVKQKSYIKAMPPQKIVKFHLGNTQGYQQGRFPFIVRMVAEEYCQVRDNALEACRQYVNKQLDLACPAQFYFKVSPVPHHVLRENKMLTGAGADRMQTGMQLSFGKPVGRAAIVKKGTEIFMVAVANEKNIFRAREILSNIKAKLPCRTRFVFEKPKKQISPQLIA